MKRRDILIYIRRLYGRITKYGSTSKITTNAIAHREEQLYNEFDPRFGEMRAKQLLRRAGMNANTKYNESLEKVIKKLRNDEEVDGFTLIPTGKVKRHPTMVMVMALDKDQSLVVRAKRRANSPASFKKVGR